MRLLEARLADDVQAEGAVFVAQSDHGKFAVDGVFDFNDLVLRGGDVRDVGNYQAARNLLLDRDAGDGILLRSQRGDRRTQAEVADPKQALDAPTQLAGNGFGQQSRSARPGVLPSRGARPALLAGLSQSQQ